MDEYINGTLIQTKISDDKIMLLVGEYDDECYYNVYLNINKAEELIKDLQSKVRKLKGEEHRKHRNKYIFESEYSELRDRACRLHVNIWDLI